VWTYQDLSLQGASHNQSKPRTKDRAFTRLPGSLSKVLIALQNKGALQPLAPRPPPNPLPRGWNPNEHCAYHQGPGHPTDNCFALRHAIQDLIDQGKISALEAPNVANNPLPNHGAGVHALFLNEDGKDPVHSIKPVERKSELGKAFRVSRRSLALKGNKEEELESLFESLVREGPNQSALVSNEPVQNPRCEHLILRPSQESIF